MLHVVSAPLSVLSCMSSLSCSAYDLGLVDREIKKSLRTFAGGLGVSRSNCVDSLRSLRAQLLAYYTASQGLGTLVPTAEPGQKRALSRLSLRDVGRCKIGLHEFSRAHCVWGIGYLQTSIEDVREVVVAKFRDVLDRPSVLFTSPILMRFVSNTRCE